MLPNCYSNQDLDYWLLCGGSRPRFDAASTAFYLPLARQSCVGLRL